VVLLTTFLGARGEIMALVISIAKTWAWSGKTIEGQASPSDCHKTAKMMSDEEL
jgi:hypothetical protein